MNSKGFWVARFLMVVAGAFVLLGGWYLLRGAPMADALREAGIWSVISAAIYTGVSYRKARNCRLCQIGSASR